MSEQNGHQWVVMKFGGTSVSSIDCWHTICEQARQKLSDGKRVLIVVSALSGVTNLLTRLAAGVPEQERDEILAELKVKHSGLHTSLGMEPSKPFLHHWGSLLELIKSNGSSYDDAGRALMLAHGELLSSIIGREVLAAAQLEPVWQDARNLLNITAGTEVDLLSARCDDDADRGLEQRLAGEVLAKR